MPYKDPAAKREATRRAMRKAAAAGKDYARLNSTARRNKVKKASKEWPLPCFVAIDGEGTNQPDGTQWYTLLAAKSLAGPVGRWGDSRTAHIENYRTGLSTEQCLNFLLDIGYWHSNTYVSFFFNYDVAKMLHDLDRDTLAALWHGGWVIWATSRGDRYYIKWIPSKMLEVGEVKPDVDLSDLERFRPIKHCVRRTTIYDTSGFFQCAFVKALKDWKVASDVDLNLIEGMKGKRNDFTKEERAAIRGYCLKECEYLCKLMDALARALWDAELYLRSWHGAGAIANALFEKFGVADHLEGPPAEVEEAVLGAYFGGRIELFQQGYFERGVLDYDLNSAYPSAAISLPSLAGARWEHISSPERREVFSTPDALWLCSWDVTEPLNKSGSQRRNPGLVGPLPFRERGRIYFPFRAGRTWVHSEELATAMRLFGAEKFTLHEGWRLIPATAHKPFGFLKAVAQERIRAKLSGEMKHIPLKLGMNSIYGKLAQGQTDPHRVPKYLSYYLAGRITARTRAVMLSAAIAAGPGVVAIATDGLFTTTPVLGLPIGALPGTWEDASATETPMLFVQPGIIFSESGQVHKTRGFGKKSLSYFDYQQEYTDDVSVPPGVFPRLADERERRRILKRIHATGAYTVPGLKTIWLSDGPTGRVPYRERRFIGIGGTVSRNSEDAWDSFGRWLDVERELRFFIGGGKFYIDGEWDIGATHTALPDGYERISDLVYRLEPCDCSELASEPYVKPHLIDESGALDLMRLIEMPEYREILRSEQPDWEGRARIEEQL